jgi:hypothetical protein
MWGTFFKKVVPAVAGWATKRGSREVASSAAAAAAKSTAKSTAKSATRTTVKRTVKDTTGDAVEDALKQIGGRRIPRSVKVGLPAAAVGLEAFTPLDPISRGWNFAKSLGSTPAPEVNTYEKMKELGLLPDGQKPVDYTSSLDEYVRQIQEQQQVPLPDLMGAFDQNVASAQSQLDAYLAGNRAYGQNTSQAVADAYKQMSQNLLRESDDVFNRGQVTAGDIDNLYGSLGFDNLQESYADTGSDTSGLAGVSGADASAADDTRVYGRSLADYLGRDAGIDSAALERTAQSQALQGAALAQSLRDFIQQAESERRMDFSQQVMNQRAQIDNQQKMMEYEQEANLQNYLNSIGWDIAQVKAQEGLGGQQQEEITRAIAIEAVEAFYNGDEQERRKIAANFGSVEDWVAAVQANPTVFRVVLGRDPVALYMQGGG